MKNRSVLLLLLMLSTAAIIHANPSPELHDYLERKACYKGPLPIPEVDQDNKKLKIKNILEKEDPQTHFWPYVFGIKKKADKILTPEQKMAWEKAIEERSVLGKKYHDERNILRLKTLSTAWRYALATDANAPEIRSECLAWLQVFRQVAVQEEIHRFRGAKRMWSILTDKQRQSLLDGKYDAYIKKSTGHTYAFYTPKIVMRYAGKPDNPKEFEKEARKLSSEYEDIHKKFNKSCLNYRKVSFYLEENDLQSNMHYWQIKESLFKKQFIAQIDGYRRLISAGYDRTNPQLKKTVEDRFNKTLTKSLEKLVAAKALHEYVQF